MATKGSNLNDLGWSLSRMGELVENLARRSKLISNPARLQQPARTLARSSHESLSRWIDAAAGHIGLEVEAVTSQYIDIERLIRAGGPAILQMPGPIEYEQPMFIALLRANARRAKVLTPSLRVQKVQTKVLRDVLCAPYEQGISEEIKQVLTDAGVPDDRLDRVERAILGEQLGAVRVQAGWLLRLPPGASLGKQLQQAGVQRATLITFGMYFIQQVLTIATWLVVGRAIFQGSFDIGWLLAWAILLLSVIPIQMVVSDAQGELSMGAGTIFKSRLIQGVMKLEPEEIRHQGIGQFLGRVMESEAVEMLALNGGFMALLSFIEIGFAVFILNQGVGGALHATLLIIWTGITLFILWRYYRTSRQWTTAYREMTDELVEHMVGHRTRLVQQNPAQWHTAEDQSLDRYLKLSENMDRIGLQLNSLISRGWVLVGLAGIAIPFVGNIAPSGSIAISLGGVLLATQALSKMASGAQSLVGLFIAWDQVGPLFKAAQRPREIASLDFIHDDNLPAPSRDVTHLEQQPLLMARDLVFRYHQHGKPVLRDISLQVNQGDRILLEGPSGGGKTTLAAVLTGLRRPEVGSLLLWGFDRQLLGNEEWRRRVVMAPQFQENHIFSETFAFNLLMGRTWPPLPEDLEDAEQICRELGLGELLDRMPAGFQQMLGESGWQLSHGERSRLYIARTLLQKTDMIILDESFGALDPENLQRSLECVLQRAPTLLVIAHP